MTLQIESDHVCALVRSGTARTGQSETAVLQTAMQQYLARIQTPYQDPEFEDMVSKIDNVLHANIPSTTTTDAVVDLRDKQPV